MTNLGFIFILVRWFSRMDDNKRRKKVKNTVIIQHLLHEVFSCLSLYLATYIFRDGRFAPLSSGILIIHLLYIHTSTSSPTLCPGWMSGNDIKWAHTIHQTHHSLFIHQIKIIDKKSSNKCIYEIWLWIHDPILIMLWNLGIYIRMCWLYVLPLFPTNRWRQNKSIWT